MIGGRKRLLAWTPKKKKKTNGGFSVGKTPDPGLCVAFSYFWRLCQSPQLLAKVPSCDSDPAEPCIRVTSLLSTKNQHLATSASCGEKNQWLFPRLSNLVWEVFVSSKVGKRKIHLGHGFRGDGTSGSNNYVLLMGPNDRL